MTEVEKRALVADASNRGWRTLLQGLAVDVAVGVALVLLTFIGPLGGWGEVQWGLLSFTLAKSIVQAVAAFIMRRFVDGKVPTPLPPEE